MPVNEPKSVIHCLNSPPLQFIVKKTNQIAILGKLLNEILPRALAAHCHVMNVSSGTLLLQLDSAAFSIRVRYLTPILLEQLNQKKMGIFAIRCYIRP